MKQKRLYEKFRAFAGTLRATVAKEMVITSRYIPNLLGSLLQITIRVVFFLFLSGFASYKGSAVLQGKNIFIFYGSALLLYVFFSTAVWAPLNSVSSDLYNGTLEYIYITPSSKFSYYFGTGLSSAIINLVFFIPTYLFLAFYSGAGVQNLMMVLIVVLVGILNCISIGVLISLLGITWKQVTSITGILSVLFEFLAGAYAPIQQYAFGVRCVAYALPFTWGYDLTRFYLLGGGWQLLAPLPVEWAVYIGMAVFFGSAAVMLMNSIQKRSMRLGLNLL